MTDQLISFETAELAREKGLKIYHSCHSGYNPETRNLIEGEMWWEIIKHKSDRHTCAPTQTMLSTWLREVHNILVYVDPRSHHVFQFHIITINDEIIGSERLTNWERTLELGLQHALQLIK